MRIVIDLQSAQTGSRFRGIGHYSVNLAKAIIRNRKEHDILIAVNNFNPETVLSIRKTFDGLLPQENICVWDAPGPVFWADPQNRNNRIIAETIYGHYIAKLSPDLLLITSIIEGFDTEDNAAFTNNIPIPKLPIAIVEYDLIPYLNPQQFLPNRIAKSWYYNRLALLKQANLVLSISRFSKMEFSEYLKIAPEKVINIGSDADPKFYTIPFDPKDTNWLIRHSITQPFLLYSGGAEPRKNIDALIIAYSRLPKAVRTQYQLVIVCGGNQARKLQMQELTQTLKLAKNRVIFLNYLSTEELRLLYNRCRLFVFPSLSEGFGLTPLEAMRCGAPVIASNTTSLPEVIGNENALFDPHDPDSICDKIRELLSNDNLIEKFKEHSKVQSLKFSWDKSASICLKNFENINETKSPSSVKTTTPDLFHKLKAQIKPETSLLHLSECLSRTFFKTKRKPKLFVDISELARFDSKSGIQRVTRSILVELLQAPPRGYDLQPVYATYNSNGYYEARTFIAKNFTRNKLNTITDYPIDYQFGDIFLGLDYHDVLTVKQATALKQMSAHGVKIFFVLHDILPTLYPSYFPEGTQENQERWLKFVTQFDGILCVSKSTANDYKRWLNKNLKNNVNTSPSIMTFHNGSELITIKSKSSIISYSQSFTSTLSEMFKRPTFLMVSTIEPRKGYAQVFHAFERLWKKGVAVNLVVVGKAGWKMDDLIEEMSNHPEKDRHFFWLKGISDEYLEKVYSAATAVIMASEGEGFGLAVVEGARHGKPLILRDIPVFREIAGNSAFYFRGLRPEDLEKAILRWLELYKNGKAPSSEGVETLTWKESTQMLLNCLPLYPSAVQGVDSVNQDVAEDTRKPQLADLSLKDSQPDILRQSKPTDTCLSSCKKNVTGQRSFIPPSSSAKEV